MYSSVSDFTPLYKYWSDLLHINRFSCNRIEQISGNGAAKAFVVTVFQTCRNVYRAPVPSVTILPEWSIFKNLAIW